MDLLSENDCFKVLPTGCSYSGSATDFYSSLCEGYQNLSDDIHKGLIKLSINTGLNPEVQAEHYAECIKKHINTFSVKMECALEGVAMDHSDAVEQLNKYAEILRNEGKVNVLVDADTLELTYGEEHTDSKKVSVNDEDYVTSDAPAN